MMNVLRKDIRHIAIGYLLTLIISWVVWSLVNITNYLSLSGSRLWGTLITDFLENALEASILYAFSSISCNLLVHYLWGHRDEKKSLIIGLSLHVLTNVCFAIAVASLYSLVFPDEKDIFYHILLSDFFVVLILSTIYLSMFFINRSINEERERLRAESVARKNEVLTLQTKLDMLSLQTNNHFIFNSLSTAAGLVRHNPEAAEEFIKRLSSLFRYMTLNSCKHIVTVRDELHFVDDYKQLLINRYSGIVINLSPELRSVSAFVPPAAIQSLVENALKHNGHSPEDLLVVNVFLDGESIVVSNNVIKRIDNLYGAHSGLENLKKRYNLLTEKEVKVNTDGQTFNVTLPLLFEEDMRYESSDN